MFKHYSRLSLGTLSVQYKTVPHPTQNFTQTVTDLNNWKLTRSSRSRTPSSNYKSSAETSHSGACWKLLTYDASWFAL